MYIHILQNNTYQSFNINFIHYFIDFIDFIYIVDL